MIPRQARFSDQLVCLSMFLALVWKVDDPWLERTVVLDRTEREPSPYPPPLHNATSGRKAGCYRPQPGFQGSPLPGCVRDHRVQRAGFPVLTPQHVPPEEPETAAPPLMGVARGTEIVQIGPSPKIRHFLGYKLRSEIFRFFEKRLIL